MMLQTRLQPALKEAPFHEKSFGEMVSIATLLQALLVAFDSALILRTQVPGTALATHPRRSLAI